MNMLRSYYRPLCGVTLPYAARQFYMHAFELANPVMPEGFEDYADPVRALVDAAGVKHGTAYLTVDEKVVKAGRSQRKPGPHVDGCFVPSQGRWGHGGWNPLVKARMPIIVASSVTGCRAWTGDFDGMPTAEGDVSHLPLGTGEVLPANVGYLLSPDCIHESMVYGVDTQRTFLRIALPVGSVQ
jgi:hypothetical protein